MIISKRRVAAWAALVCTSALALAACKKGLDVSELDANACDAPALSQVKPKTPVDYLELRDGSASGPPILVAAVGTKCGGAKDPSACRKAFETHANELGWPTGPNTGISELLVFTRGDEVGTATDLASVKALLVPIDSAQEAALVLRVQEHSVPCGEKNAHATADGFDLFTRTGSTCGPNTGIDEHLVHVATDGTTTVLQSDRVEDGNPNCVE